MGHGPLFTRLVLVVSLAIGPFLAASCVLERPSLESEETRPLPEDVRARYEPRSVSEVDVLRQPGSTDRWDRFEVAFRLEPPVVEGESRGSFDWYVPKGKGRLPVVLVSPILKGDYALEHNLARTLAAAGFSALVLHQPPDLLDPDRSPADLEMLLRHYVVEAGAIVSWLGERPEIDPERIGVLGISMGGIKSCLLLAVEPRIRAGAVVIGGGDLAGIFEDSVEPVVRRYVRTRARREQTTEEAIVAEVRAAFRDDPLALAGTIDSRKVLLILARFDQTVPYRCGERLAECLPHALTIVYPAGHYSLALFLGFVKTDLVRFFRQRL